MSIKDNLIAEFNRFMGGSNLESEVEDAVYAQKNQREASSHLLPNTLYEMRVEYQDESSSDSKNSVFFQVDSHSKWFKHNIGTEANCDIYKLQDTFEDIIEQFRDFLYSQKIHVQVKTSYNEYSLRAEFNFDKEY